MKIIRENFRHPNGYLYDLAEEKEQKRTIKIRVLDSRNKVVESFITRITIPDIYYVSSYRSINQLFLVNGLINGMLQFKYSKSTNCFDNFGGRLDIKKLVDLFWNTPFDLTAFDSYDRLLFYSPYPQTILETIRMGLNP